MIILWSALALTGIAPLLVWLARSTRASRALRSAALWLAAVVVLLAVIGYGTVIWAWSATDSSQFARALLWGESDTGDIDRFPARVMEASSRPVVFPREVDEGITSYIPDGANRPLVETVADDETTGLLIIHDGRLVHESYHNGAGPDDAHTSFSMAKSFMATAIGAAVADGHIDDLDTPITTYLPELAGRDERFGDITIRHLLAMASGLRFRDGDSPWDDPANTYYGTDLRRAALEDTAIVDQPGTTFHYNDWNPILLGLILERTTGMSVAAYVESAVWGPMGAEFDGSWSLDSAASGFEKSFVGVNARPIDFAKLGWLYLNDGTIGQQPVVPSAFVAEATAAETSVNGDLGYQYLWWVDEDRGGYFAAGDHCQFVYVHPPGRLVITRVGTGCGSVDWPDQLGELALWLTERYGPAGP